MSALKPLEQSGRRQPFGQSDVYSVAPIHGATSNHLKPLVSRIFLWSMSTHPRPVSTPDVKDIDRRDGNPQAVDGG